MRYALLILSAVLLVAKSGRAQIDLKPVTVSSERVVDTVFGTWKYSVADFEFIGDKLVLLTFGKSLEKACLRLADASQKVLSSFELPDEAEKLYKDYQGFINVICKGHIYRVTIENDVIHLGSLPVVDYQKFIMPCVDSAHHSIYFSNYQRDYPEFTYYAFNSDAKTISPVKTICDQEVMHGYNMEYYFLKPKERVYARKLADFYGVDKHRIAASMSGLTSSMYYSPLYSPLYIIKDTVCVFDHSSNAIFKYDQNLNELDSIPIDYNHPKSWREWKNEVIVDKESNKAYALYQKNGFYYLKRIDLQSGKIISSFKLSNQYVEKIKIKGDYVYYVYRPFESLQEKFVYKELISN
ncbi:MAG TPA: hypothetical protein VGC65_04750 [Bacteroidia bacterium]